MRRRESDDSFSTQPAAAATQGVPSGLEPRLKILSISAAPEDHESLRCILHEPDWGITRAFSYHQATTCLCWDRAAVIVCDCHLPDGTWRDILSHIAYLTDPPPLIVTTKTADANLLAEVQALGGYAVLDKPFSPEEVRRVLTSAWRNRWAAAAAPASA